MKPKKLTVENEQPLIINGMFFKAVVYTTIHPKNQKRSEKVEIKKISKNQFDKIVNMYSKPVGKSINNTTARTSDGVVGEGGFG